MSDEHSLPLSWSAAVPGERVFASHEFSATATNDYMVQYGELFRRFAWCSDSIAHSPAWSPRGEWFAVRGHWKQFRRNAAA